MIKKLLFGFAVLGFAFGAHASLILGSTVDASLTGSLIGFGGGSSSTASFSVGNPASNADLFLDGIGGPIAVDADFIVSVTDNAIVFGANDGFGAGDAGETITFSGLMFDGGATLLDIIVSNTGAFPISLPTLVAGSLTDSSFTLDLNPITVTEVGEEFEITFVTSTVTVPAPAMLSIFFVGLGILMWTRRPRKN